MPAIVAAALLVAGLMAYAVAIAGGWTADAPAGYLHWPVVIALVAALASTAARAIKVPGERRAWGVFCLGLTSYTIAELIWMLDLAKQDPVPYPSISDVLWLAFYPAAYTGLLWLVRARFPRLPRSLVLDGLIAAMAVAALACTVRAPAIEASAKGLSAAAQLTTFAYPLLDLALVGTVGFVCVICGWRPGRTWALLGAGLAMIAVGDAVWSNQVAGLLGGSPGIPNLLWATAWLLIAAAAWQPVSPAVAREQGRVAALMPLAFASVALGLLVLDHFERVSFPALILATGTVVLAMLRTLLTVAEERALAETRRQALTDELTGLPNRRAFLGRLAESIEGAREEGATTGLLMVDLDRFKELNDTLGHAAGDDLLAALGPRLQTVVGRQGRLARLGGDEFGVILPRANEERAIAMARALRSAIERPFDLRGLRISVGASIGVALYPLHATSGEELLQHADVAMYLAKHGGGGVETYAADRDRHSRDRLVLAADLRHAIGDDRLSVLFQPKADARSGEVGAVEALVRWQHHSHGPIPPDQFVPLAEQTGLGRDLTRRVLEHSVRQAARWNDAGRPLRVAVNLCAADLADPAFPDDMARLLARWRVPASLLAVEVTENTVLADPLAAHALLARLNHLGVESSLDDFGTGHSSLTHLRRLPVSEIKLDRSFVAGMVSDRQDACIVHSTVELAARLGLRVVAEGVEDDTTWGVLRDLGCDEIQGYVLAPALPASELTAWLDERDGLRNRVATVQAAPAAGR